MSSILTGSYWTSLASSLVKTVRTYPRESLIAFAMSIAFSIAIADPENGVQKTALRTGMGLLLGISISIASTVFHRSGKINTIIDWLFTVVAVGASVWHAHYLNFDNADGIVEYTYLVVLVHLLVASAWTLRTDASTFWNSNTSMFYRVLFALVFTSLLVTGLTTATAAVRILFGLLTFTELEGYLSAFAYGFFMTLFFLAEMPTRESSQREPIVPKLTIAFVQYVLVPLIAIFTSILYAYAIKLMTTSISTDMAVYVVWLAGTAIFASLLTWPLRNESQPLLKFVHRWLYPLLLPLLGMGLWSLWIRYSTEGVDQVGFTLGVLTSIGLLTVIVSMITRTSDPRIPTLVSLTAFAITSVGPLGINAVVHRSESHRPKDEGSTAANGKSGDLPAGLDNEPHMTSFTGNGQWVVAFNCSPDDTLRSADARITSSDRGIIKLVRYQPADTVYFDLQPMLVKLDRQKDSVYPRIFAASVSGKRATLQCMNIGPKFSMNDNGKDARRRIGNVMGLVVISE